MFYKNCFHLTLLFRFLNNFNYAPTLARRHRSGFDDSHFVANCRASFIMSHKFLSALDIFSVNRMFYHAVNANRYGFRHFVRRDDADFLRANVFRFGFVFSFVGRTCNSFDDCRNSFGYRCCNASRNRRNRFKHAV